MDFGALPPEINSALMYIGPGSAPMTAAASAWNGLAAELNAAATAYEAVITGLASEEWLGPASASMAEAIAPYVAWMSNAATQSELAATKATAAAAAYEAAHAAIVPPQLVALNRAELTQLLTANVFGQYTNAIAALEAQYGEMWAQDAAVMYQYAGSSATATKITPFASPPQTTSPAAAALQSGAVTQAAGTAAGSAQQTFSNLINGLQTQLASLASPSNVALVGLTPTSETLGSVVFNPNSILGSILTGIGGNSTLNPQWFITAFRNFAGPAYNIEGLPYFSTGMANTLLSLSKGLTPAASSAASSAAANGLAGLGGLLGGGGSGVAASMGQAASVGKLSVPAAIAGIGPAVGHAAPLPISTVSAAPDTAAGNLLGGLPLAGAGSGAAATAGPRYGFRPTVMARPPFAG
ncbi:PPE family protein PPE26 [Mycobacterium attenuatum]|uniref:PPE family protein n=1 Tax=Mycobacterium attenuatum TaxID=2341086 RepID=UPI000F01B66E|nr:PPE family protein [Mycobacterium attenuatum]VBA53322.1 PPE family protein PPE26 [Mycobacterium attenuatum]